MIRVRNAMRSILLGGLPKSLVGSELAKNRNRLSARHHIAQQNRAFCSVFDVKHCKTGLFCSRHGARHRCGDQLPLNATPSTPTSIAVTKQIADHFVHHVFLMPAASRAFM